MTLLYFLSLCVFPNRGNILHKGAGREAWERVSMIAPVKKSGQVRLSTGTRGKEIWRTSASGKRL